MGVKRFDRGTYGKPKKLPNGFLRADALLTRVGVFTYVQPDGTHFKELRLPEEVFSTDSLDTLALAPLTDEHPAVFLTAANAREYSRGSVGEKVSHDGEYVHALVMVTDQQSIARIEDGSQRELSCGYTCELEAKPGKYGEDSYDAVQRNIVYNHVALVTQGRAGPEARVRMDASSATMVSTDSMTEQNSGNTTTRMPSREAPVAHKVRIDGVEYEVPTEQVAQAFSKVEKAHADGLATKDAELKSALSEAEKLRAKVDAQLEELKKARADLKAAPEKMRADIAARLALEGQARKVLGAKAKLDAMDAKALMLEVLAKLSPELKLEGKSDDYIQARFDLAMESADAEPDEGRQDAVDRARVVAADELDDGHGARQEVDSEKSAEKMRKDYRTAWKRPLGPAGVSAEK